VATWLIPHDAEAYLLILSGIGEDILGTRYLSIYLKVGNVITTLPTSIAYIGVNRNVFSPCYYESDITYPFYLPTWHNAQVISCKISRCRGVVVWGADDGGGVVSCGS
jgi:hypothetical protein